MWQGIELRKLLSYLIFQNCPNADAYMAMKDHFKDMEWLQFTGLTDKNGKEIYEGDIIESDYDKKVRFEVLYKLGGFWCQKGGISFPLSIYEFEVIGNIYENPEILNP